MPLKQKSDDDCINCESADVWEYTKAGESVRRLNCEECLTEWSEPA